MTTRPPLRDHPKDPVQIDCPHCGETHPLEEGRSNARNRGPGSSLYYRCGKHIYTAGDPGTSIPFVRPPSARG